MRALRDISVRLLLAVALCVPSGCSTLAKLLPGHVQTTSLSALRVAAQPGANLNSSTAIDLVFVYDSTAVALLPQTGPDWFARKPALENGLGTSIDVVPLEVPPATVIDVSMPKRHGKAIAVYGFARYLAKDGQGRIDLTRYRRPVIWLAPAHISLTES